MADLEVVTTVQYLLAAIGAATVTVLLWKAFGPQRAAGERAGGGPALAPDDDPEFLRGLNHRRQEPDEEA
ncbi:MAG: hypothetical protein ACRDSL_18015 [Pseudonocardiaceae bacterium]